LWDSCAAVRICEGNGILNSLFNPILLFVEYFYIHVQLFKPIYLAKNKGRRQITAAEPDSEFKEKQMQLKCA